MYARLRLFRTGVTVTDSSTLLTITQVRQAFSSRTAYSPERVYDYIIPRFKTTPGASAAEMLLTSGAVTELAKNNYSNWNWGRCPAFVPDVASGLDFHFIPSLVIPFSDKEILLLINESTRWGVAFVQGLLSNGYYQCTSRFMFVYSASGTVDAYSNSISTNSFGLLGYQYVPSADTLHLGFATYNEDLASYTLSRISYSLGSGQAKMASIRTYVTGIDRFYREFLGAATNDEACPTDEQMDCVVSLDGDTTFQLYADTNFSSTSGSAKFFDMSQLGILRGKKVTIDYNKLDPYYLNTADFYESYNRTVANRGSGISLLLAYADGDWKPWVPSYVRRLLASGFGGSVAPGGGSNDTPFNVLLKEFGHTLTTFSAISTIPNPATTSNNARSYYNVGLAVPNAQTTYFSGDTEGAISVVDSDPKYISFDMRQERYRDESGWNSTIVDLGTLTIPCYGGYAYWQDTPLLRNSISLYIDKNTNKAVRFSFYTPECYQGSIYVPLNQGRTTSAARTSWLMSNFAALRDYDDDFAAWYGGSPDNPSDPGELPDPNDYNPNGPTVPEMNPGSFDDSSDAIPLPDKPTISVVDAGLVTLFNPTLSQLQALSKFMWSDMTTTSGWFDTARKIFADPMQYFIALNILPFDVPSGSTVTVKLAGISTGVSITKASSQFVDIDCGSYALNEYWGSALDYAPSTKIWCFLPFVGSVPLDPDMVMKSTIRIVYRTDILTGAFVAFILANENVLYHFNGNMATNVPLTGADYSRLVSAIIGAASTIALTAGAAGAAGQAAMGVGAARTGLQAASAGMNQAINTVQAHAPSFGASMMRGGTTGIAGDMFQMLQANADELTQAGRNMGKARAARNAAGGALAASGVHAVHNTVNAVMAAKPSIAISGQMSGCSGLMDIQYPYLIIQRPNQALPENYKHYVGYPSHMLADVQSCRGYTVFEQIELSGIPCTDDELAEINDILKGGFYG